ncbi:MAG: NAD(P)H-dependent oxidoreductase subunit E [Spirochaetota bacterium]|nr:NAD(P)H-dependent oxidoreductase subunit E [Spirochaetota bacterium]
MTIKSAYEITSNFNNFLEVEELAKNKETVDNILSMYKNRPGALIPVLQQVQQTLKYLPPVVQDYIAHGLNIPSSDVFGVVSFYSFFSMTPRGENIIRVCLGTACYVKGAGQIVENLERGLNVKVEEGGTTEDRKFTLEVVRCIGACGLAPVVVVNEDTYGMVDPAKSMDILKSY